jgi:hypothetical protein
MSAATTPLRRAPVSVGLRCVQVLMRSVQRSGAHASGVLSSANPAPLLR